MRRASYVNRRLAFEEFEDRRMLALFTVVTTGDAAIDTPAAVGTIRQAIEDANDSPGPDEIVFDPTVFPVDGQMDTITLTEGELIVTDTLTISGPGSGELTINGDGLSRVLSVAGVSG